MRGQRGNLRLAFALRRGGLALMAGSALIFCARMPAPRTALAQPFAQLRTIIAAVTSALPATAKPPVPSPSPSPTPGIRYSRGGPIRFTLSGSLSLGESGQSNEHGDAADGTLSGSSSTTTTENAGLLAHIERRTASTSLMLNVPAGIAASHSTIGELQAGYYTGRYGLLYGTQSLSLLGGVPLGSTLRGYALMTALRGGDITFFEGPAYGMNFETQRVTGFLARKLVRGTLFEVGADRGESAGGSSSTAFLLGAARTSGLLTQSFESAIESLREPGAPSHAYGYQYRADYGSNAFYTTVTARRISNQFLSFGNGAVQGDDLASVGIRDTAGYNALSFDEALEATGAGPTLQTSRRGDFSFQRSFSRSGLSTGLTLNDQRTLNSFGTQWLGGAGLQLGVGIDDFNLLLGTQFQRDLSSYADPQSVTTYNAALQRQFGLFSTALTYQTTRQTGPASALQSIANLALTRSFGATALTFAETNTHIVSTTSNALQMAPTVSITQRVSPAVSLALTYGEQLTHDSMNPSANGRTRIFNVQLAAPFALGSGTVQGRIDPRLPATISGTVTNDLSQSQFSFGSSMSNGVPNIMVVLDNQVAQRTDLSGHYQFNFVSPGMHQLRIETSSLPRGVTVDQPYASINVLGGQTGQMNFLIGTFGGVSGHVFGRDSSGAMTPLQDVTLQLDGTAFAKTDNLGAYAFGRLTAGKHTVAIVPSSVPATVSFAPNAVKQQVVVQNGSVSTLDFNASPLGSIAGMVTFDPAYAAQMNYKPGVMNAYVVAEPGDYAAITNDDGSYYLDNLPPGTYTVDLDPETTPDETGNMGGAIAVTVEGNEHKDNVDFTVGRKTKAVVFSFKQTDATVASLVLSEPVLPPGGATAAIVDAGDGAKSVVATAFQKSYSLHYDESRKRWLGMIFVPPQAHAGDVTITADVHGAHSSQASADLKVDPNVPLILFHLSPAHPVQGQYATVRARFLNDVKPGDEIHWLDGQITKLSRPITGRVYEFTVKISEQPMRGLLLTKQGQLPITLR